MSRHAVLLGAPLLAQLTSGKYLFGNQYGNGKLRSLPDAQTKGFEDHSNIPAPYSHGVDLRLALQASSSAPKCCSLAC